MPCHAYPGARWPEGPSVTGVRSRPARVTEYTERSSSFSVPVIWCGRTGDDGRARESTERRRRWIWTRSGSRPVNLPTTCNCRTSIDAAVSDRTETEYQRKITWVGDRLRDLRPDIVGLQELWHADAIRAALQRADLDDDYDVLAEPATGGEIVCAALVRKGLLRGAPQWVSRFPAELRLQNTTGDPQAPDISVQIAGFSRPVLTFDVALREAPPLTKVFVAHLKSKLPAQIDSEPWFDQSKHAFHRTAIGSALSTIRRTAEATALRLLLTDVMKGTVTLGWWCSATSTTANTSNTLNIITEQPRYLVGDSRGWR